MTSFSLRGLSPPTRWHWPAPGRRGAPPCRPPTPPRPPARRCGPARFGPLGCLAGRPGPDVITAPHPAACLRGVVHVAAYATYVGWADSLEHRIILLPDLVDTSDQAAPAAVRVIDTTHLTPAEAALRIAEAVKG